MERRDAIKTVAITSAISTLPKFSFGASGKSEVLKVGLIGCSGRGLGAVLDMIRASEIQSGKKFSIKFVAIADLFDDRNELAMKQFEKYAKKYGAEYFDVQPDRRFFGWDAYKQLLALDDIDIVIHATPPVFRPLHIRAIVEAKKHIFVEKPACVDANQARELYQISELAKEKGLTIIPGVQRRFHKGYIEGIKRMQDGQIGDIIAVQAYWLNPRFFIQDFRLHNKDPESMEYQIRNWFIFRWASGDCYVEQHVHNLDVVCWALGKSPYEVTGMGGRRWDLPYPEMGDRFSHFSVDYDYGNGLHCASYSRREPKTCDYVLERFIGTKGVLELNMDGGRQRITGKNEWTAPTNLQHALIEEHIALLDSVRNDKKLNMLNDMVDSTLMAIAGRESSYSGQRFKFDWFKNRSKKSIVPEFKFGKVPLNGIPLPGEYKLS